MYYSTKQVADILGVTVNTVKLWLKEGKLKGGKFGKSWRISQTNLRGALPEGAFEESYPKECEEDGQRELYQDTWKAYQEKCKRDLDRRFPYPYQDDDYSYKILNTETSEPDTYYIFCYKKREEENLKLNRLLTRLKEKHGVSEEDIAEIKRTYENIHLLEIGQVMTDV